jgi:ATP-dependent Clp protease adaptor protein ClpS
MENELQKTEQLPEIEITTDEDSDIGLASKVILYNDDWHSFDEVILQLIKAVNCTFEQGRAFAFEVHVKGKSIVFHGPLNQCLKVSSILEEIALNTQVIT